MWPPSHQGGALQGPSKPYSLNQFIKKKLYQEKKEKLRSKSFALGFLNGLINGRKKLKTNLFRDEKSTTFSLKREENKRPLPNVSIDS